MSLFQNSCWNLFHHIRKHAKNYPIVPLFLYDSYSSLAGLPLLGYFLFLLLIWMLFFIALRLRYFLMNFIISRIGKHFECSSSWFSFCFDLDIFHDFNKVFSVMLLFRSYLDRQRKVFTTYANMYLYTIPFFVAVVFGIFSPFLFQWNYYQHIQYPDSLPFW